MTRQTTNLLASIMILAFAYALVGCDAERKTDEATIEALNPHIDTVAVGVDKAGNIQEHELAYLVAYDKKYPKGVRLFDDVRLARRLQALMGAEYDYMLGVWKVESPIEVKDGFVIARACEQHNCDVTNFIVVVEQKTDQVFVGVRKEGEVTYYGETSAKTAQLAPIKVWAAGGE